MNIIYKKHKVNFNLMTEDLETTIAFRNFFLFNWDLYVKIGGLKSDEVIELTYLLDQINKKRAEYHKEHCKWLETEWLGEEECVIDFSEESPIKKTFYFDKKAIIMEFIRWLQNRRIDNVYKNNKELVNLYSRLISDLESNYSIYLSQHREMPV